MGFLGRGQVGTVIECVHIKSNMRCAVKRILKKGNGQEDEQKRTELEMLLDLDNPHIVRVIDICEDNTCYYIVFEMIRSGNLYDMLERNSSAPSLKEADIANIVN